MRQVTKGLLKEALSLHTMFPIKSITDHLFSYVYLGLGRFLEIFFLETGCP